MVAVETGFEPLSSVLPMDYGIFEPTVLDEHMRLFSGLRIKQATANVFGRIY